MLRYFSFPCMTIVRKLKISPRVKKFQMSPHDRCGEIWNSPHMACESCSKHRHKCKILRTFMWRKIEPISTFVEKNDKYKVCGIVWKIICTYAIIAKDCLLTLIKSRLALGTLGCSVGRHHAKNGPIHRKMVVNCPLVIISKVKLFFRPDKTRKKEWMVQPVFCIVDAGSCLNELLIQAWPSYLTRLEWPP